MAKRSKKTRQWEYTLVKTFPFGIKRVHTVEVFDAPNITEAKLIVLELVKGSWRSWKRRAWGRYVIRNDYRSKYIVLKEVTEE